jgi:hypothetical protein
LCLFTVPNSFQTVVALKIPPFETAQAVQTVVSFSSMSAMCFFSEASNQKKKTQN